MDSILKAEVEKIISQYDPKNVKESCEALRSIWSTQETKSMHVIKADLRDKQETLGTSVPVLKEIAKVLVKPAQKDVQAYLPFVELLWTDFGREGRVIAAILFGKLELEAPEVILPKLYDYCKTCLTWEDADRMAMDAVEPIIRKDPANWFDAIRDWAGDENKWVRRTAATVYGRLAMKHPEYTTPVVAILGEMIYDTETDVKKAVSFGFRLAARGDTKPLVEFLQSNIPPEKPEAVWVLCDTIRSMGKKILPDFKPLRPLYESWLDTPGLETKDKKSIQSAIKTLISA